VKVLYALAGLASEGATLRQQAEGAVNDNPKPAANLLLLLLSDGTRSYPYPADAAAARIHTDWLPPSLTGASSINGSLRNCSAGHAAAIVRALPPAVWDLHAEVLAAAGSARWISVLSNSTGER